MKGVVVLPSAGVVDTISFNSQRDEGQITEHFLAVRRRVRRGDVGVVKTKAAIFSSTNATRNLVRVLYACCRDRGVLSLYLKNQRPKETSK